MPRRREVFIPGEYYHVYNRGVDRRRIFFNGENYLYFLRKTREYLVSTVRDAGTVSDPDATSVRVAPVRVAPVRVAPVRVAPVRAAPVERPVSIIAYCLMPNHFHLLVYLRCQNFSARMSSLQKSYTQAINRARERVGPLFQGRFRAEHVDRENYLIHLSRYIHLNPVVPALVATPADWEYSSYRDYIGLRDGSLPEPALILREFAPNAATRTLAASGSLPAASVRDTLARNAYRDFVERGTSVLTPDLRRLMMDL